MSRWQRRVDDLLYDGETVRERLDVDTARVVVTSHRVLVFTPEMDGENFRQADRPNVTGVEISALAWAGLRRRGLVAGLAGVTLLVAGLAFDPESIFGDSLGFDTGAGERVGLGGIMDATRSMFALLRNFDTLLVNIGLLALVLSSVLLGVYWYLRTPTLVIRLAGETGDVHIPRPETVSDTSARLEAAIFPDPAEQTPGQDEDDSDDGGFIDDHSESTAPR
ncbi:hypothetical protein [Halovenus salina]|uniref:hypothetical protein n=1 Tax=Halovenus salina TaxID=1510225 RepID=UPI002260AF0B|nr:hypothetical protein [Halovenus salina]